MGGRRLRRVMLHSVRDLWLIMGIALVMLATIEAGYRGQRALRAFIRDVALRRQTHPGDTAEPPPAWSQSRDRALDNQVYDGYLGWRLQPAEYPGLHVDSLGHRLTVNPVHAGQTRRRVLMLGGSTMWGYTARDSQTIPSLVAEELARRGRTDAEVVNLANVGYNLTQGVISLLLELRAGHTPAAVVSLDGVNEVFRLPLGARPGESADEARARQVLGRRRLWQKLLGLGEHLQVLGALNELSHASGLTRPSGAACDTVARYYEALTGIMEALGKQYGFVTIDLFQPTLARTHKLLSGREAAATATASDSLVGSLEASCSATIDERMAGRIGGTYMPLHDLYDADSGTVFLDQYGHVAEAANRRIAVRIADLLEARLGAPVPPEAHPIAN